MKRNGLLALLILAAVLPCPAAASVSIAGGGFTQNTPPKNGGAFILSTGASIPQVPLEVQGSFLVPVGPGGYALTAEIRGFTGGGYGGAYIGGGAGIANISSNRSAGTILTVFAGKSIAPQTSFEIRFYKQMRDSGGSAGFIGLRLTF